MMVGNVSMNNVQQQDGSKDASLIDREIRVLQEQIKRVSKDDKMPPDEKAKKVKELEEKIAQLQERKMQIAQKAQQNQKTQKAMADEKNANESDENDRKLRPYLGQFEDWV